MAIFAIFLSILLFGLAPYIIITALFCISVQNLMRVIQPQNRFMSPGNVWLLLIPVFNLVYGFFVVNNISRSIQAEYDMRGRAATEEPAMRNLGIAYCVLALIPFVPLATLAALIVGIIYWVNVKDFRKMMEQLPLLEQDANSIFNKI